MEIQVTQANGDNAKWEIENLMIADGTLTWYGNLEEVSLDMEDIETILVSDSPAPALAAENERLRAVLEKVSQVITDWDADKLEASQAMCELYDLAEVTTSAKGAPPSQKPTAN